MAFRIKKEPSQEELKIRFLYSETGNLLYKATPKFLPHLQGKTAGSLDSFGYVVCRFNYKSYKVHRLIWVYHYGEIPEGMYLDHINKNKQDNRIENLRLATMSVNMRNRPVFKTNTSGVEGVNWDKTNSKWRARAMINGVRYHLGCFQTLLDAKVAIENFKKRRAEYAS